VNDLPSSAHYSIDLETEALKGNRSRALPTVLSDGGALLKNSPKSYNSLDKSTHSSTTEATRIHVEQ